jgi:hypothetical protein
MTAEGVSADSAYTMMMATITPPLDATKKAAVMALIPKFQTDLRAAPPGARAGRGGPPLSTADSAASAAANAKRTAVIDAFRTEVKKSLTAEQGTALDALFMGGRRGGGGGGI